MKTLRSKLLIFFLLFLMSFSTSAQNKLTILVDGVTSSYGHLAVGIFDNQEAFLKEGKAIKGVFAKAEKGTTRIEILNMPNGKYAISIFHDENDNHELDTNFFGIPKEPLGFSIGKLKTFGPPSFDECVFEITSDFEIRIPLK